MDKRYQVFVSSTYEDLKAERQHVIQALLELDCIPAGMELFPAADEDQWTLIKKIIDDCDYYIVIVGGRYGSVATDGVSYTQMEYEYAIATNKPVIGFLHKDLGTIPAGKSESSDQGRYKLDEFRKVVERKPCKYWSTADELGSVVSRSLIKLIKNSPAIGWVKADLVPDENYSKEILRLKGRVEELEFALQEAKDHKPSDTENLSQGEETFWINYHYTTSDSDRAWGAKQTHWAYCFISWNSLFAHLAPTMLHEAPENRLSTALNEIVHSHVFTDIKTKNTTKRVSFEAVAEDDFHTIIIQLRALGLITKSVRNRSVKDTATYWKLTPYGDRLMMKLRAIQKPQHVPEGNMI